MCCSNYREKHRSAQSKNDFTEQNLQTLFLEYNIHSRYRQSRASKQQHFVADFRDLKDWSLQ